MNRVEVMDRALQITPASELTWRDVGAMLWRRVWFVVIITGLSLAIAAYVTSKQQPLWKTTTQLLLVQRVATSSTEPSYAAPMMETPETQLSMLKSPGTIQRAVDWLKNEAIDKRVNNDAAIADLQKFGKELTVTSPKDTNLMEVTAIGSSAEIATHVTDAIGNAFVRWKNEIAQRNISDVVDSLENRVRLSKEQLVRAEQEETGFKRKHGVVDVPKENDAHLAEYLTRDTEVKTLKQDLISQEARLASIGGQLKDVDTAIRTGTAVRDDSLVLSLQTQLNAAELERADAGQKYTKDYPGVLPQLDARIAELKDRLATAVQSTLDNKRPSLQSQGALYSDFKQAQLSVLYGKAKLSALVSLRDQLKTNIKGLPQTTLDYARLQREITLASGLYTSLQASLNSVRLDKDRVSGNVQLLQSAQVPERPFRPDIGRNLLLGGMVGLLLSLGIVLILENVDQRVRKVEDVRRIAGGTVIGALPRMSRREMRSLRDGEPPVEMIEAYGHARANLFMALRNSGVSLTTGSQVILVTSALPGEGKSLTTAELARSLARSGKSVLLIDADMRRGTQHKLFNTAEPHGLADVLHGKMSIQDAIVASDTENLVVLHSGTPDQNPTELIGQPRLAEMLAFLRTQVDIVLIDTPATSVVADALFVAPFVDCIVHVVGAGQVDEAAVRDAASALKAASPKNMVFLVNRAPKGRNYGYSSYYYRKATGHNGGNGNGNGAGPGESQTAALTRTAPPTSKDDASAS